MEGPWRGPEEAMEGPGFGLLCPSWSMPGCQGPQTWVLVAAGGSLFLAFPTTWTSPVITLLPGGAATATGLSKDQRLA